MRRLVNQVFLIPIFFIIFGFVLFSIFYTVFIKNITEKQFNKIADIIVEHKKDALKTELNSMRDAFNEIRLASYTLSENTMYEILKTVHKNINHYNKGLLNYFKNHKTENMFFFIISNKLVYPKISEKYIIFGKMKHLIVEYKNKKYLAVELKDKNKTLGIAISLNMIDNTVKKEIVEYVEAIDKHKSSYVVVVHITDWKAKKGIFAKTLYHPMKSIINKPVSLDKTDIDGYPYRKKYFECLKTKNECFVTYHFKNPVSGKIEKKLSYFTVYRPYNFMLMKGYYYSTIQKDINEAKKQVLSNIKNLYKVTLYMFVFFILMSFIVAYFISKKIKMKIIEEYNTLKNNYENAQKELLNKVYYDPLTKLPNRYKLFEEIGQFESLCVVDIDDFSYLNDIYGFETGNEILKYTSCYLQKKYKDIYRIGSDEFAIGFKNKMPADEIKNIVNSKIFYKDIKINFSVGVSYLKDKLFETAETALKFAYKDENVKYKIYDESIQLMQKERIKKIQQLSKVLEKEAVIPYYQCIVNSNGEVVKYEALMRVQYENQIYTPFQFMDIIKEAKLYSRFSRLMIKKVFEELKHFSVPVSINLSFSDINNQITRELVLGLLEKNSHGKVVFEILETENIEQFDIVYDFINEVKKYGAKIAIDDFGSGYSNLVNILNLHPDYLKIDASLVKNLDNQMYVEIIKFIIEFAKKFNIKTTAEFVSDEEKFFILKNLGIDEFQGFYFCKPQPIADVI